MFKDRKEARELLARALAHFEDEAPVIVGLSRGGVPVAFEVVNALNVPPRFRPRLQDRHAWPTGTGNRCRHRRGQPARYRNCDIAMLVGAEEDYIERETKRSFA